MLLAFGILTISVAARWPVAIFDASLFALAAVWAARLLARPFAFRSSPLAAALAAAAAWPLVQLAAGSSVYRFETFSAALVWAAHLTVFLLALQLFGDSARLGRFLDALL
ncbi:MAG TPA: hypothetical protein VN893_02295, partial [Bryobacteraceae bacterium]|nr:hypothetical protein [Bryobacteraceae bacterium]